VVGLTALSLENNKIDVIPAESFSVFTSLETLTLNGNPLAADIEKGSLDALPSGLRVLQLNNVGLKAIPKSILQKNTFQLLSFYLSNNQITAINKDDLSMNTQKLQYFYLDNNPLATIELGSFATFGDAKQIYLQQTKLTDLDLAVFNGLVADPFFLKINVYSINTLKTVRATSSKGFPATPLVIRMWDTTVETVDSSVGSILALNKEIKLAIDESRSLRCSGTIDWIAPYVYCTNQVTISDGTVCADRNNMRLADYLKSVHPEPCTAPPYSHAAAPAVASIFTITAAMLFGKAWGF